MTEWKSVEVIALFKIMVLSKMIVRVRNIW